MAEIIEGGVIESFEEVPDVRVVRIRPDKWVEFKPGQYFQIFIPEGEETVKPYSVASPPSNRKYLEFCVKRVEGGHASNFMFNTEPGERLKMQGPMGRFVLQEQITNDIIFAATGTGISSIKPMIRTIFERGTDRQIWLFFGIRTENDIIYKKDFETLASKHKNFHFVPSLSRASEAWNGERGYVQDVMKRLIKDITNKDIYLCGVAEMVEQMRKIAEQLGFPKEKIHFEKYV
ncbi:MAG: hypothetical protein HY051_03460 [Candidatus Aenigmarchaeota archaeon]|nr:hypothetical protein [Candidatus Aenigmarchaeota archaeon]